MCLIFKFSIQTQQGTMGVHWARAVLEELRQALTLHPRSPVCSSGNSGNSLDTSWGLAVWFTSIFLWRSLSPRRQRHPSHSGFHIFTVYCPTMALRLWTNCGPICKVRTLVYWSHPGYERWRAYNKIFLHWSWRLWCHTLIMQRWLKCSTLAWGLVLTQTPCGLSRFF